MTARIILLALCASVAVLASDAPVLSDLQHARAETLSARYDAADAKLKSAQAEMDRVKQDVQRFLAETRVDGYDLDITTLIYAKQAKP